MNIFKMRPGELFSTILLVFVVLLVVYGYREGNNLATDRQQFAAVFGIEPTADHWSVRAVTQRRIMELAEERAAYKQAWQTQVVPVQTAYDCYLAAENRLKIAQALAVRFHAGQ